MRTTGDRIADLEDAAERMRGQIRYLFLLPRLLMMLVNTDATVVPEEEPVNGASSRNGNLGNLDEVIRASVVHALEQNRYVKMATARALEISPKTLYNYIRRYEIPLPKLLMSKRMVKGSEA